MTIQQRVSETPNATMTTLASPTCGPSEELSMWRVQMADGATGPAHIVDSEQIWVVDHGALELIVDGQRAVLEVGESAVFPPNVERRITARGDTRATVAGHGSCIVRVPGEDGDRGTPPWIA